VEKEDTVLVHAGGGMRERLVLKSAIPTVSKTASGFALLQESTSRPEVAWRVMAVDNDTKNDQHPRQPAKETTRPSR
jgi:hypothetical protein